MPNAVGFGRSYGDSELGRHGQKRPWLLRALWLRQAGSIVFTSAVDLSLVGVESVGASFLTHRQMYS
jgi:hypothetical protein